MHLLTLFLDGVGLGVPNPVSNPFVSAHTPTLNAILGGNRLLLPIFDGHDPVYQAPDSTLFGLDANLGISGPPQSASGQATILTGLNIPARLGFHYGPKPNPEIITYLDEDTLFHHLKHRGYRTALVNAYPPSYFKAIESGHRLPGTIAMAVLKAGIPLMTLDDLITGRAISADFTAQGWQDRLKITGVPILSYHQAGYQLAQIARTYDFSFFEFWLSDYAGHKLDMAAAIDLLETFDQVLTGMLSNWDINRDLIVIISDHGNLEDLSTRGHTRNLVPCLVIGPQFHRHNFFISTLDLTGILPAILQFFE